MTEKRPRREWTTKHDELLRRFHAEGKSDTAIAYIMDRLRGTVRFNRSRLGLKTLHKGGSPKGWTHGPAASAKMSDANRRRWADPAYRQKMMPGLVERLAEARTSATKFKRPPKGTPEFKQYRKIAEIMGPAYARQNFGRSLDDATAS